ncbi:MAG TPA: DUF2520 domain-containing protein [Nocardioidaceae bacterium]|nr:DUF2520 domain-containing protein [Nocardioidaceae bacterium]
MSRYRIGVIGAGRVGAVLGAALREAGHDVAAISGRSAGSHTRAETLLPGVPVAAPTEVARIAELLLLTVPDDVLPTVIDELAGSGVLGSDHIVVHTSGRHGVAILDPIARTGARVAALHPAMTFTGTDVDLSRLPGCVYGLTSGEDTYAVGKQLVDDLGGTVTVIPEERRTLYHSALVHGANHLVTLVSQATALLRQAGSTDPAATLRPLLTAALDNSLAYGDAALTGPVVRGDQSTVSAHLDALVDVPGPTLDAYLAMARATVDLAVSDGRLSRQRARALVELFDAAVWEATAAEMVDAAGLAGDSAASGRLSG